MVQIVFDSTAPICSPERTTLPLTSSMPMTVCRMTDELLGADLIIDDLPLTVLVGGTTEAEALDVLAGLREVTEAEWSALIEPEAEVVILD